MTRSIFDPAGGQTERSGSRNLGPDSQNLSHMPPDAIDGKTDEAADEQVQTPPLSSDAAAPRQARQDRPCRP